MIDYDATLKVFFAEVIKYLNNRASHAEDGISYARIEHARDVVKKIAENPLQYADYDVRVKNNMVADARAFMPNNTDTKVFRMYRRVLEIVPDLYDDSDPVRHKAQDALLTILHEIKYRNSKNLLKSLYFSFIPVKKYAVKANIQKTK